MIVFMKAITSHPYGHESLRLPIEGVLFQLTTCIINDIWGVVIFEPVHDDFSVILNGNIFQTAPSSEFRTGSSLEKYVLSHLTAVRRHCTDWYEI